MQSTDGRVADFLFQFSMVKFWLIFPESPMTAKASEHHMRGELGGGGGRTLTGNDVGFPGRDGRDHDVDLPGGQREALCKGIS